MDRQITTYEVMVFGNFSPKHEIGKLCSILACTQVFWPDINEWTKLMMISKHSLYINVKMDNINVTHRVNLFIYVLQT